MNTRSSSQTLWKYSFKTWERGTDGERRAGRERHREIGTEIITQIAKDRERWGQRRQRDTARQRLSQECCWRERETEMVIKTERNKNKAHQMMTADDGKKDRLAGEK